MELTEHGVEVLKAIKSKHVEALGRVLCADDHGRAPERLVHKDVDGFEVCETRAAVSHNREALAELARIIRVVPLGMPR